MTQYILLTGAPGSKWSSVAESLSRSPDIDTSDSTSDRAYNNGEVKHKGSYFDPGMEFENDRDNWDKPFSGTGHRIIKSHTFAHKLNELKSLSYPIDNFDLCDMLGIKKPPRRNVIHNYADKDIKVYVYK
jgi:hypothetical protein